MDKEKRRIYIADYNLKRYHRRMAEAYEILGGECVVCGGKENLQIDHLDPDQKSFTLGKLWSAGEEKFLDELTKCQLLCDTCHKTKTLTMDQEAIQKKSGKQVVTQKKPGRARRTRPGILKQR